MNLNEKSTKPLENSFAALQDLPEEIHSQVRVEPCEFEGLLQRAMEILSIRAQTATATRS